MMSVISYDDHNVCMCVSVSAASGGNSPVVIGGKSPASALPSAADIELL